MTVIYTDADPAPVVGPQQLGQSHIGSTVRFVLQTTVYCDTKRAVQ